MTRDDFIIATALILFAAFVLGWFSCWLIGRLTRPGRAEFARHHQLAADLHSAEAARDQAVLDAKDREAALHERLAFASSELTQSRAALEEAGVEIEELREYIETHIAKPQR
jgi:hypothetical protein